MPQKGDVMSKKIPVLITTDNTKRGVFMGFIDPADEFAIKANAFLEGSVK
jgi:hypothetical protein